MSLSQSRIEFRKKVTELKSLPVLPAVAKKLLELRDNENAGIPQLTNILSSDPVLSAHILKYANTAFFGSNKKINTLPNAISRIGYTIVLNMAIGISTARIFTIPADGPIGMKEFWRHAVYSAHLMRMIASKIPTNQNVNPEIAFLCGLLHNIGYVFLGDQFRGEFNLINNNAKTGTVKSLLTLEDVFLGMQHTELGVMLMRAWKLPSEIVTAIFEHHNQNYVGTHWQYANLTLLANYLLRDITISDMRFAPIPDTIIESLHLSEKTLDTIYNSFMRQSEVLDAMIESFFH